MSAEDSLPETDRVPGFPPPSGTPRIFGQDRAEAGFLDAWGSGRIHHAWLLRGPAGIGKATLAYRMARALIATGPGRVPGIAPPETLDPPPGCPVLGRIQAGAEANLRVLRRTANDKGKLHTAIRIDEVRKVREFLQFAAPDGGWRAVIVDSADEMTPQAANAFLKFLEEPPARTALILVAHSPGRLLPTIRSRCRTLDLAPLGAEDLARALAQAGAEVPPGDAAALAALAQGSVGGALRLAAGDGLALYRELCGVFGRAQHIDRPAMMRLAGSFTGKSGEARYILALELLFILLGRIARAAAGAAPEAIGAEKPLIEAVGRSPEQARIWAEAAARLAATGAHARAVNLDPAQTVIDTFLDLDDRLGAAHRAA